MSTPINKWLNKKFPQNFIIKNPYIGVLIFLAFCIFFLIIYKPHQVHESKLFSIEITIIIYCIVIAVPLIVLLTLLKRIRFFSDPGEWTILKEILLTLITLLGMGIVVYLSGFLLEESSQRLNLSTFTDSLVSTFLVGLIPFLFFTLINYRYLFVTDIVKNFNSANIQSAPEQSEELIAISSRLKKEELAFYPSQFIYAESDGNYVVFHLMLEGQVKKKIIRNSISNIEEQLSAIPFFVRIHRAYIINVKRVSSQKGNTLGYRIRFFSIDEEIPVSRQNTREFDKLLKLYL
jgi:hypothetical protein